MEKKISVIVPIYNSSNFLPKLLDRFSNQTYDDFEVIFVDDGSTDNSKDIILDKNKTDKRIMYFFKENGGASSARNFGLQNANGRYITFIDSDDDITNDYLRSFISFKEKTNADLIAITIDSNRSKHEKTIKSPIFLNNKKDILDAFFCGFIGAGPTSKLFDKEKVKKICFDTRLDINEDKLFVFEYLLKCDSAFVSPGNMYKVCERADSVSHRVNLLKKADDLLFVYNQMQKIITFDYCDLKYLKYHNINTLLYIFKVYFQSNDLFISKSSSLYKIIKTRLIALKKEKGCVSIRLHFELFGFLHLYKLYCFVLSVYYGRK